MWLCPHVGIERHAFATLPSHQQQRLQLFVRKGSGKAIRLYPAAYVCHPYWTETIIGTGYGHVSFLAVAVLPGAWSALLILGDLFFPTSFLSPSTCKLWLPILLGCIWYVDDRFSASPITVLYYCFGYSGYRSRFIVAGRKVESCRTALGSWYQYIDSYGITLQSRILDRYSLQRSSVHRYLKAFGSLAADRIRASLALSRSWLCSLSLGSVDLIWCNTLC